MFLYVSLSYFLYHFWNVFFYLFGLIILEDKICNFTLWIDNSGNQKMGTRSNLEVQNIYITAYESVGGTVTDPVKPLLGPSDEGRVLLVRTNTSIELK